MTDDDFEALAADYFAAKVAFNAARAKLEPARVAYFAELERRYRDAVAAAKEPTP